MKSIDKNVVMLELVSYITDRFSLVKPLVVGYILFSIYKPLFGFAMITKLNPIDASAHLGTDFYIENHKLTLIYQAQSSYLQSQNSNLKNARMCCFLL